MPAVAARDHIEVHNFISRVIQQFAGVGREDHVAQLAALLKRQRLGALVFAVDQQPAMPAGLAMPDPHDQQGAGQYGAGNRPGGIRQAKQGFAPSLR